MIDLDVIYEDNHLLVVNKPAGIATMGAESGPTVHSIAADYIKHKYDKPGKAFVGIVSRLDSMTSGVLVLARTSKAASRLSQQFAPTNPDIPRKFPAVEKFYVAVLHGELDTADGTLTDFVVKDDGAKRMRVVGETTDGAKLASLDFHTLSNANVNGEMATAVVVRLKTGRKHQIRVQFASAGAAVWGDRKYQGRGSFPNGIALHSCLLRITHPTLQERMEFYAPLPGSWKMFQRMLPTMDSIRETIKSLS